ncbi:MAG: alpha/beta hydrolase [Candidatus Heimdallarchaeota archaeon]|nr:alpha/beta hydrolase [Candidatus Heimdallarchaeota archaeon]MCK4955893.1 alpha/beta hydrolase [Candidatus Heimdallarchaeota archaeon]
MDKDIPFIVVAAGYSNYDREYPAHAEKFGENNVVWTTTKGRFTVQEHIDELHELLPKDKEYLIIGHSMGIPTTIELMNKIPLENCKGAVFVAGSRTQKSHWFFEFLFRLPVPLIYVMGAMLTLMFPINLIVYKFNIHKAFQASFDGIWRLVVSGAGNMKKEYWECVKKIGRDVHNVLEENRDIPILFLRLAKDKLVLDEDVKYTKTFFTNIKEKILPFDSIHLTHDYDYLVLDIIGEEIDFFGYKKITTSLGKGIKKSKKK